MDSPLNPANISLQQLFNEQYIKQGNILFYNRTYKNVKFTHKCKIKDIYNTEKLLVFFTSTEKLMSFDSLSELELYILKSDDRFKKITRATGSVYDWFYIIDKDVIKGSIIQLRKQYVKDKEEKEEKEKARLLGKREILPVLDPIRCKILDEVKNEFEMKFEKEVPFSYVCEGLVDDKEVIIAYVNQLEGTLVRLPAEFKGFPVLISYEALVLYHRSFHKDLTPGISIGKPDGPLNACTLGPLFQNTTEPDKTFILTAKHGVGKEGDEVVQPGTLEQVTKYNFGADSVCRYLDYAFCEIVKDRTIPEVPNVPLGTDIQIRRIKTSVGDNYDFLHVQKVGRTTYFREGLIQDKIVSFHPPVVKKKHKSKSTKRFALRVIGINCQTFSECGDSGSAVLDGNGLLWGIVIAGIGRTSFVIPIHWILDDVKKRFDGLVFTLKEDEQEDEQEKSYTNLEIANCSNLPRDLF